LLEYAVLASETDPHDPMEQAFHHMAGTQLTGTEHLHPDWTLAREYELSSGLLAMSHVWRSADGTLDHVAAKGAPEAVADLCHLPEAQRGTGGQTGRQPGRPGSAVYWRLPRPATRWHNLGPATSMTLPLSGWAWSAWPTRCALKYPKPSNSAGPQAYAW
jgi:hypothetical protein